MIKKISIEFFNGELTLWKLNKRGYYNFITYLDKDTTTLSQIKRKYKDYEIIDKTQIFIKGESE